MHFNNIYARIKEFETKENISNFNSEYGNLWPLFRMFIFNNTFIKNYKKLKKRTRLYRIISNIKQTLILFSEYKFKKTRKLKKDEKTKEIWLSNYNYRKENKEQYNKYSDPFFIKLADKNAVIFEYAKDKDHKYGFNFFKEKNIINNTVPVYLRYSLTKKTRNLFNKENNYNRFIKVYKINKLIKHFPEFEPYNLFIEYLTFLDFYNFYSYLWNKFPNLEKIYLVVYYFSGGMAAIASANNKNKKTIEIQHGMQSEAHYAYGNWNYIPENGFNLLPKCFYVFSENEKILISKTFKNKKKVKIVGDLAFEYWQKQQKKVFETKNIILITLQNNIIPENHFLFKALEAIAKKTKYKIIFRLHPRHLYIKPKMEKILKKFNFPYFWDENKEVFDTLYQSVLHITFYSSVVEDALRLNVPSVVIDKTGMDFYEKKIKNNPLVNSALNKSDLLKYLSI